MIRLKFVALIILTLISYSVLAAPNLPKTSQHSSFKPDEFQRIAVIVKQVQIQSGFNPMTGMMGSRSRNEQSQLERLIEQRFMRVLLDDGYTLVSRADLDSAMKEKGLDEANLTDEKLTEEAGKMLHVSAIMVVSVDNFKTLPMQRVTNVRQNNYFGGNQTTTYYQISASLGARLVKIKDNMVMWTGDYTYDQAHASPDVEGQVFGTMAEIIAKAFPPLLPAKNVVASH